MNAHALKAHWFFVIAPMVLAINLYVGLASAGEIDRLIEAGLLFDLAVLLPCLYWLCYRRRGRSAVVKALSIACIGIWVALKLVPEADRDLLRYVAPLRYVGLAALIALEVIVVMAIYRTIFKGGSVDQAVSKAPTDMPPWVVRLLAFEAKLWLHAWGAIKRLTGRR